MKENKLIDKIALITGGNSGIGLATARLFREQGATIAIVGQNKDTLENTRQELGGNTLAVQANVANVTDLDRVMAQIRETFGRIDILFANAGISECPPIEETEETFFNHIMGINVKGVFFSFEKALPLFSQGASVIFTSSVAHKRGRPGDPLYAASKAAVRSLARTLAVDEKVLSKGIRVNVVSPGAIRTPLTIQDTPDMQAAVQAYIEASETIPKTV